MTALVVRSVDAMNGPRIFLGEGELALEYWHHPSRSKDQLHQCVIKTPSVASRERFLEAFGAALGAAVPSERAASSVTRVVIDFWVGGGTDFDRKELVLGPARVFFFQQGPAECRFSGFSPSPAEVVAQLAATLRGRLSPAGEEGWQQALGAGDPERLVSEVRDAPRGLSELDTQLLADRAAELPWPGQVRVAELVGEFGGLDTFRERFLRDVAGKHIPPRSALHAALSQVLGSLNGEDPEVYWSDHGKLIEALRDRSR